MGRKSAGSTGRAILGTGVIRAHFHWRGTTERARDKEKRWAKGAETKGEVSLRNQGGIPSLPTELVLDWIKAR